ncbi:MAG: glycosyltransferase [Butyrivibrio sp.]|nr:glycosyltransferase [Butyrivibrio sp.]
MDKMKIMQVIGGLGMGGAENLVTNYCINLDKETNDVTLLCVVNMHSVYDKKLQEEGIHVIYINDIIDRWIKAPVLIRKFFHFALRPFLFRRIIKSIKPDVIHLHAGLSVYVALSAPLKSTGIYMTIHTDPARWFRQNGIVEKKAIKWLSKHYKTKIIALHKEMVEPLKKHLGKDTDIRIFMNGIELDRFRIKESRDELRQKYGISPGKIIIGHVGRFAEVKNHFFLIEVFNHFQRLCPETELWLVGDGALRKACEEKLDGYGILEKTVFWGNRTDIAQLVKMMDLFVFPSFVEGLSITVIEAQAVETPILASDKVSKETVISNLIDFKSLGDGAYSWAEKAKEIIGNPKESVYYDLARIDIKSIVRDVEAMYRDEE